MLSRIPLLAHRWAPSRVATAGIVAVAAVLAYIAGRSTGDNQAFMVVIFAGIPPFLVMIGGRMERAILAFVLYGAFEGLLKNVTSNNPVVFLLRDVFLIAILGKLLFGDGGVGERTGDRRPTDPNLARVVFPVSMFIFITIAQIFNPMYDDIQTGLVIGLGGIHQRILPIVLFFAMIRYVKSKAQVERIQKLMIYMAIVVAAVLLVQIALGPERWRAMGFSFYSQGAGNIYSPSVYGGVPRPASTAQDSGAAAWFILIGLFLSIGVVTRKRLEGHGLAVYAAISGFLLLALALTYMRTAYMSLALGMGIFLLLRSRDFGGRVPIMLGGAMLVLFIMSAFVPGSYLDAVMARAEMSVLNPVGSYTSGTGGRFNTLKDIPNLVGQFPFGVGTGRTGPGQATFSKWFPDATFFLVEQQFAAIIVEGSIVAGMVLLWLCIALSMRGAKICLQILDSNLKATAVAAFVCVVVTIAAMFSMNPLDASPFNSYFWLTAGLLMALPRVEAEEKGGEAH